MRRLILVVISMGLLLVNPVLIAAQEPSPTCDVTPGCLVAYLEALQSTRVQLEKEIMRLRIELDKMRTLLNRSDPKGGGPK